MQNRLGEPNVTNFDLAEDKLVTGVPPSILNEVRIPLMILVRHRL